MEKYLPAHQDSYAMLIRAAVWANPYQPRYQPSADEPVTPETAKARALAGLKAFGRRAEAAISAFKEHKAQGRA